VAQDAAYLKLGFGPGVALDSLPAAVRGSYACMAAPVTAAEQAKVNACMSQAVCTVGSGKLSVGDLESNYEVPYRKTTRQEILLAAIRDPQVGKMYFSDAAGSLPTFLTNFRTMINENVDVITGSFDFGSSMLSLSKQAISAGLTVVPGSEPFPAQANSSDLTSEVIGSLCGYGQNLAKQAVAGKSSGTVALLTGPPGNSYGAAWQACAKPVIQKAGWKVSSSLNTNWTPQGEQQAASALITSGKPPDSVIYDYDPTNLFNAYLNSGKTPPNQFGGAAGLGSYAVWKKAETSGHKFTFAIGQSALTFFPAAVTLGVEKKLGQTVPLQAAMPMPVVPASDLSSQYDPSVPVAASFNSGLPASMLTAGLSAK
jgi:ABC-type sugar transport system substrate-binding protein